MEKKILLVRSRSRAVVTRAHERGFTDFLLDEDAPGLGAIDALRLRNGDVFRGRKHVGHYLSIASRGDEHRVRALKGKAELVVVELRDWKVIPLENLIAALEGKTKLYAVAKSAKEAKLFLETLERGVDGVVILPKNVKDLESYRALLGVDRPPVPLKTATITRIQTIGMGERVCVDTANMFEPGEGLLVGSTSHGFFLVSAECFESEYVAARPFRVNAGAVHSYVWNGDKTTYLSEVRAGVGLEAVDSEGHRRPVIVGRAKIETRPLLLIEAAAGKHRASIVLQNAETIRLVQVGGRTRSVSRLKVGDRILIHPESGARHFGMKVEERIREI